MMPRALRENGAAAVSMAAISSTLAVVVTVMLSLEIKLMALSLVWVGLYLVQRVLVGKRRCSGHWLVQYGAMAAYYLPAPLAFYAAKAVCSTSHFNESTPFLVLGVLYIFHLSVPGQDYALLATNMRAYSLRDRPRDRYKFLMWLVFLGCVDWEWARISGSNWPGRLQLVGHMGVYFVTASFALFPNTSESTELDCQTKAVADYMKRESSKSSSTSPFFDDDANSNSSLQLDCCRYPFVQEKDGEWVTVKDLVQRNDLPNEDRDIWLSYSLSRLLARRYYGFHCAEEGDDKVRRFTLADLGRTNNGYKRAFTIVEVQLAFLHDYFFTASLPIIESGLKYIDAAQDLTVKFTSVIFTFLSVFPTAIPMPDKPVGTILMLAMAVMTMLLLSRCALIEFPRLLVQRLLAIYWRPIHTAFHKLNCLPYLDFTPPAVVRLFHSGPNPDEQDAFHLFQTQIGGVYWRNKIGQYSILQDYDRRRSLKKGLVAWFQGIMLSQPSYKFFKHLPVEEEEVDMLELDSMRKLVADTLHSMDGPPTNGTRSLKINKDEINSARKNRDSADYDWLGTCKQETHTDTILIWHIATCYCDISLCHSGRREGFPRLAETDTFHKVATTLSRYCAYLVAFLPEFLPEHSLTTKQVFQRVLQEAQSALGTTPTEEKENYTKTRELLLPHQHEQRTTFYKGVELGRQLEMLNDDKVRWKVIAEFWAETILYVAPSDNAEAHIEQLAKGGEFITHLWAMLSNAGIAKRATGEWHPPASTTKKGPPKKIETTKATTQEISIVPLNDDEASTSSMSSPPIQSSEPTVEEK